MGMYKEPDYNQQKRLDEQVSERIGRALLVQEQQRLAYNRAIEKELQRRLHERLVARCAAGKSIPSGLEARHDPHTGVLTFKAARGSENTPTQYWMDRLSSMEANEEVGVILHKGNVDLRDVYINDAIAEVAKHIQPRERAYHAPFEPREERSAMVGWDGVRD